VSAQRMVYYIVYFFTKFVSFFLFPRTIYGKEHIPLTGGVIFASNHVSNLDPVVLGVSCIRRMNFMAKDSLFKGFLGWLLVKLGSFPVKRGEADLSALKEAIKRLKKGKALLIFVEGTRRIGNELSQAQPGVGFIAVKAGVPVIPVYINGTQDVMPPGSKTVTRKPVTVRFGPAVKTNPQDSYQQIADSILKDIYSLQSL
jgi:1-acyl-sn-glycerol-3-phosphate acyltransferase